MPLASQFTWMFVSYVSASPLCARFRFAARIRCCSPSLLWRSLPLQLFAGASGPRTYNYTYIHIFWSFALHAFRLFPYASFCSLSLRLSLGFIWLRSADVISPFSIPHIFVPSLATSLLLYVHMYVSMYMRGVCMYWMWLVPFGRSYFYLASLAISLYNFQHYFALCCPNSFFPSAYSTHPTHSTHPPFSDRENSVCVESGGKAEARKLIIMLAATKAAEILSTVGLCARR